jgi:hypothetical protein
MSSIMKKTLVTILKGSTFNGDKLSAADRVFLRWWADDCADDPIWEKVVADARAHGSSPSKTMHSTVIYYALEARKIAEDVKSGYDPIFLKSKKQREELLALAEKSDDLARYFQQIEKYSGTANFFQRFLVLPVLPEQEAVRRVEPPFLRVQQLQKLHKREAELLRQQAGRARKPTTFISRKKAKRHVNAFIHLMTDRMDELCGKQHRRAVALLATMASKKTVYEEAVRKTLMPSTKEGRRR